MNVFRIARSEHNNLTGEGARLYGGRWNSPGTGAVYCSQYCSLAVLEFLVHFKFSLDPPETNILTISFPDDLPVSEIKISELPSDWNVYTFNPKLQKIGDKWLKGKETLLLKVPSVIIEQEYNYIINPSHKQIGRVKINNKTKFKIDARFASGNE